MKYFALIFSVYFLALSVMPCNDAFGMNTNNSSKSEFTQSDNNNTERNDICSPFCTCSCCNTPVYLSFDAFSIKANKPVIASRLKLPVRNFSFASNFYVNIWQPPKINA